MTSTTFALDNAQRIRNIRRLTRLMEGVIKVPGTRWTFGIDPLLGLLPVGGDVLSMILSTYLIHEAWQLGAPRRLIARMMVNVATDTAIGAIPLLGDVFDFFYKSNTRNLRLLDRWLTEVDLDNAGQTSRPA